MLAPAGSPESLTAAVRAGADAVYLGGGRFSARAGARNFSADELKAAVEYCHARGVKVYLAVNTVLLDDELPDALSFVKSACALPVDAVLTQDMGLVRALKLRAPGLPLHASTQMSVHTACGAAALLDAGFQRVVLARELSLAEIAQIHRECPIELEAFVHGALCMSVSGQCYFSSVLGSRSGNRGLCAQPCRLPFSSPGGTGHDLSLKDLSMIPRLRELADAGVCSAKIEGRLKRPEYVAAATHACRLAADGEPVPSSLLQNLGAVFSRSGFTTGYPDGKRGRAMFGVRTKEDAAEATGAVLRELKNLYRREFSKIPVDFTVKIKYNKPITVIAADREGRSGIAGGRVPEPAESRAVDRARCEEQMKKTGGTPFFAAAVSCEIDEGLSVPVSELNALRRSALGELERMRSARPAAAFEERPLPAPEEHRAGVFRLRARFADAGLPDAAKMCELVYLPYDTDPRRIEKLKKAGFPIALEIPRGMFGMERAVRGRLLAAAEAGVTDVWAGTLDGARLGKEAGLVVHGGFSLNVTNTQALEWYREFGLADLELSFELTLRQASRVGGTLPRGLLLYGRLPLMLCRCCPAANSDRGCLHCKTAPELTDRRGVKFPIQCAGACSEVLNSVPLFMADRMNEVKNADFGLLRFTTESASEAGEIIKEFAGKSARKRNGITRGLYFRGIE